MEFAILGTLGFIALVMALLAKRSNLAGRKIAPRSAVAIVGVVVVVGLVYGWRTVFPAPQAPNPNGVAGPGLLPRGDYPTGALNAGDPAPPLEAQGWLNGSPPSSGYKHARLMLVDLWSSWCPGCRETAPGLVEAHAKFKDRGVVFVSVTNLSEPSVAAFIEQSSISWPCGYGTSIQTIAHFGALNRSRAVPGYETMPTLYLVGPDGRVRWSDRHGRTRHLPPEPLVKELESEIERLLAEK